MVAIKATEGTGYIDPTFYNHRQGALSAGVETILYYHFARPDLNGAVAEADWLAHIVGPIRANDRVILDYEKEVPQATTSWAVEWLARAEQYYPGKIVFYSYEAYISERLQDPRLPKYPLWLADYTYNSANRPACPLPWKNYDYLQYTDRATGIPGVPGTVDANVSLTISTPTPPKEEGMILHDTDQFFKDHFTRIAPDHIHCKNGQDIAHGMLTFYMQTGGTLRLPLSHEIALDQAKYPGVVLQIFEGGIAVYDEKRTFDNPPVPGPCYLLKLDGGVGQSIIAKSLTDALQAQVVDLQKQLAALQSTPEAMQLQHLQSIISQIKTLAS
jgi:GH25 family lysozyme M1 (1,4-beta-N-acetylmuramidase)